MRQLQRMSESERRIMTAVWLSEDSITAAQLQRDLFSETGWRPTTVLTFLSRLVEKGLLSVEKRGKTNHYTAAVSQAEYRQFETQSFLDEVHHGSLRSFMAALSGGDGLTEDELRELSEWFSETAGKK